MRKPRIIWFIPNPQWMFFRRISGKTGWHPDVSLPSVWIRSFQIAPYLQKAGFSTNYNSIDPLPDIAIFLRRYGKKDIELAKLLKSKGVRIILDVVANYFEERPPDIFGDGQSTSEQVSSFLQFMDIADQIWTVSPFLKTTAEEYHSDVHFVSDSIDTKHFNPEKHLFDFTEPPFQLGWSGTSSKAQELNYISPLLNKYINQEQINVTIISKKPPKLYFKYQFRRWKYSTFPNEISKCDLCIAPRRVINNYDRGHSLFKIGVFMAMGVPAFAGPVPSYKLILGNSKGGKICSSYDDWDRELNSFIENKKNLDSIRYHAIKNIQPYFTQNIANLINFIIQNLIF
jgi:hypothetical protein